MRKYITEFIGTFFLVLIIAMTGDPVVIGSVLMVMVYAGGHISGAHYNPAVTVAILLRGRINTSEAIVYIVVQIAGAVAGAFIANWLLGNPEIVPKNLDNKTIQTLIAELVGTFALAYVVLNVATAKGTAGNSYYGLAIGFTVFAMAAGVGNISGGAFNPAVAVGVSAIKLFAWSNIWIYLVGCFGGGVLASMIFKLNNPDDK